MLGLTISPEMVMPHLICLAFFAKFHSNCVLAVKIVYKVPIDDCEIPISQ